MLNNKRRINKGFMTLEILVSAFIITLAVLATMDITQRSTYLSRLTFHGSQAVYLNEEAAEALRIMRDNSWTNWVDTNNDNIPDASPGTSTIYYLKFANGTWMLTQDSNYYSINDVKRKIIFFKVKRNGSGGSALDDYDPVSCSSSCASDIRGITINTNWMEGSTYHDKLLQFYMFDI